jgi:hypothetical protein
VYAIRRRHITDNNLGKISIPAFSLTLFLSVLPILVFLLLPAQSDPNDKPEKKSSLSYLKAQNDYGSEFIDDESRLYQKEPVPLELSEESDLHESDDITSTLRIEKTTAVDDPDFTLSSESETAKQSTEKLSELTTVLNVTDADIEALVKTFSKLTGRNYIVDSSVKGKITIHLPTPITLSEALRVFDSVLLLRGFATVPVSENIWKVISAKDAKQTTIPMVGSKTSTDESLVTEIIKNYSS